MSGLRFFADTMHDAIRLERERKMIEARAENYLYACEKTRRDGLQHPGRRSPDFYAATEGMCAVRKIMGGAE
jgi:hypothetical protein